MSRGLIPLASAGVLSLLLQSQAFAEVELRPPQSEVEVELEPDEPAAEVRIFWTCYGGDLASAARAVVAERREAIDCELLAEVPEALEAAQWALIEERAGGRKLGDPEAGEQRTLDPAPGETQDVREDFCYRPDQLDWIRSWARQQQDQMCAEPGTP